MTHRAPPGSQQTWDRQTAGQQGDERLLPLSGAPRACPLHSLTRCLWASCSCCTKSRRASHTESTSTSGLWSPGAGEGHRSGERDRAGGLALCRGE